MVITGEDKEKTKKPDFNRDTKVVPKSYDLFNDDIQFIIYGDKVAVLDFNSDTALTIENPKLARFQEKIFKLLFRKL